MQWRTTCCHGNDPRKQKYLKSFTLTAYSMAEISEEELQATYAWIDEIPLSRQKKSIARDFSDGGTVCERHGLEAVKMLRSRKEKSCQ